MSKFGKSFLTLSVAASVFAPVLAGAEELSTQQKFDALKQAGVFAGFADGSAGLDQEMTRAQFAAVITKLLKLEENASAANFSDLGNAAWAKGVIGAVAKAGLMKGVGSDKFDPNGKVTVEQLATVLVLALKLEVATDATVEGDVSAWAKNFVATAVKAGLIAKQDNFAKPALRGVLVDGAFVANKKIEDAKVLKVESAVQTGAKKIVVKFNKQVKEGTKVEVKNGYLTVDGTLSYNEARTEATVTTENDLVAGTYKVEVEGAEAVEVKVEASKVASLEITTPQLQAVATQNIKYKAVNQFGEEFEVAATAANFNVSGFNITDGATANPTLDGVNNDLDAPNLTANKDDEVLVTLTHKASGVSVSKKFKVVAEAVVSGFELAEPAPLKDKERIAVSTTSTNDTNYEDDLVLPLTLKDQYGNDLELNATTLGQLNFLSSNTNIVDPTSLAVNGENKLIFNTGSTSGKVTITAVAPASGVSKSVTFEVFGTAALKTIALSQPTTLAVDGEALTVNYAAKDQFGKDLKLTAANQVTWVSSDNAVVNPATDIAVDSKGVLKITPAGTGTVTIYAYVGGELQGQIALDAKATAVPTKLVGLSADAFTKFAVGGEHTFVAKDLVVVDQYNRTMKEADLTGAITVSKKDATKTAVTVAGAKVTGNAEGSEVVTISYTPVGGTAVTKDLTVSTIKVNDVVSYEIEAVENTKLWDNTFADVTAAGTDAKEIKIAYGKDSNGNKVYVDTTIDLLTTSNSDAVTVTGSKVFATSGAGDDKKATITAWENGKLVGTLEFTTSNDSKAIASVKFSKESVDFVEGTTPAGDIAALASAKDQYGNSIGLTATWFTSNTAVLTVNATTGAVTDAVKDGTATVTAVTTNGVTATITVNVDAQ